MSTVKIRILETVASTNYAYAKGKEVDAPIEIAADLVQAGHAEYITTAGAKPAARAEKAVSPAAAKAEKH